MKIRTIIPRITQLYHRLLKLVLTSRMVKVNRERYIRKLIRRYYPHATPTEQEQIVQYALSESMLGLLDERQQQKAFRRLCWHYGTIVFWVSFFTTTVPDNAPCIILACIIDLYIYQCMDFRAKQKILILYGFGIDLDHDADHAADSIIERDNAIMMNVKFAAVQRLKSGLGFVAKQVIQRQGPKIASRMSKTAFMVIRRQCIKWFSVVVAKEQVSFVFDMLIPFTCALISGTVSVLLLVPMCKEYRRDCLKALSCPAIAQHLDAHAAGREPVQ